MDKTWILSSKEFIKDAVQNKRGLRGTVARTPNIAFMQLWRDINASFSACNSARLLYQLDVMNWAFEYHFNCISLLSPAIAHWRQVKRNAHWWKSQCGIG